MHVRATDIFNVNIVIITTYNTSGSKVFKSQQLVIEVSNRVKTTNH